QASDRVQDGDHQLEPRAARGPATRKEQSILQARRLRASVPAVGGRIPRQPRYAGGVRRSARRAGAAGREAKERKREGVSPAGGLSWPAERWSAAGHRRGAYELELPDLAQPSAALLGQAGDLERAQGAREDLGRREQAAEEGRKRSFAGPQSHATRRK